MLNKILIFFHRNRHPSNHPQALRQVYDLILVQDKIYQVKLTHTTKMLEDNGTLTTDKLKNKIIQNILNNFKEGTKVSVNNGKITFELGQFIAKVEIIKKVKMPE